MRRRPSITRQALVLHLGVLVVVLLAGVGLVGLLLRGELEAQFEQRALGIARSVAADPAYAADLAAGGVPGPEGDVQRRAEAVRARTGALFIVVADREGVRWSHPTPALIGQRVSTDPSQALGGADVAVLETGTLGLSARGKVPLRAADGTVVGEVSVGIDARRVHDHLLALLRDTAGFAALALALAAAAVVLLVRRLKRQTLGLEPAELSDLVREHQAVLRGVQDGVVALDGEGVVTMSNESARQLLGPALQVGRPAVDALPPRLHDLLRGRGPAPERVVLAGDRVLVVSASPVTRGGLDLGTVLTVRDRTDLDELGRELATVRSLFDALRAQAHEYTNRLHAVAGLLQLGHVEQARDYLHELRVDPLAQEDSRLRDPYLRGLLAAKSAAAAERGVRLELSQESSLALPVTAPLDLVTVLGNLVDNAVQAAAAGARRPAWVEVAVAASGATLRLAVTDSGDGLAADDAARVFDDGWTTRPADGSPHGLGLALARQTARRHGGEVRLLADAGPDHGAVFAADLPGVLDAAPLPVAP